MAVPNDPAANPQPDVDLTVGQTPLVGDAPPSEGTGVDVSVAPTTGLRRILRAVDHHAAVEGFQNTRLGSRPPLPASSRLDGRAAGFHTAAARAAAFPGLQSEVETFGSGGGAHATPLAGSHLSGD
jgi:hypothetical protein